MRLGPANSSLGQPVLARDLFEIQLPAEPPLKDETIDPQWVSFDRIKCTLSPNSPAIGFFVLAH